MLGRKLKTGEKFVEGNEYTVVSVGWHDHWPFTVGKTYKANADGLIDEDGDECYEVYETMVIHLKRKTKGE